MIKKCDVILADDDADDRMFLVEALQDNSFSGHLCEAENGKSLLEILEYKKANPNKILPYLIVLDLNMPLLNGFEVLKILKNDNDLNKIPVVVLTSSSRKEDENICKNAGCLRYIRKPHSISGYSVIAKELLSIIYSFS